MAFPVVEAENESNLITAGTSHVVSLPAFTGGSAANDIGQQLLILLDKGSTAATFNALAGWTEVVDENAANGITVWVRDIDGTEGSTVTFTSSASTRSAHLSYRISGAARVLTQLPQLSTVATGTSVNPNATTCTPTGGAKDYLWITFFGTAGEEADDDTWVTVTPANYANLVQKACGTAGTNLGGMIGAARRTNNAASEDAGAFTKAVSTAWRAYTIAVHPRESSTPTVTDSFARADSSTIGNDSNGNAWVETAGMGAWEIFSNSVRQTNTATEPGRLLCGTDMLYQGHWIEARLAASIGEGSIGLLVRLDATAFTCLSFEIADGSEKLIEVSAGSPNTVFTGDAHTHASGEVYAVEIKTDNTINFYRNNSLIATTTSAFNVGDTRVGLHFNDDSTGSASGDRWHNFRAGPGPYPGMMVGSDAPGGGQHPMSRRIPALMRS